MNMNNSIIFTPWCFHCGEKTGLLTIEVKKTNGEVIRVTSDFPLVTDEDGKAVLRTQDGKTVINITVTVDASE